MNAPTGRNISVIVSDSAIALSVCPSSFAMYVNAYVTRQKSTASSVEPRQRARTAALWALVEGGVYDGACPTVELVAHIEGGRNGSAGAHDSALKAGAFLPPGLAAEP